MMKQHQTMLCFERKLETSAFNKIESHSQKSHIVKKHKSWPDSNPGPPGPKLLTIKNKIVPDPLA